MAPRDDHERYPSIDFENIPGYPHEFSIWGDHPMFEGYVVIHIVEFLEYLWETKPQHEDIRIKLFIYCLPLEVQNWVKDCCKPKGISSLIDLISIFIEYWRPNHQTYEDVLRDLTVVLEDVGFTTEIVEDLRKVHHAQNQEPKEEICEEPPHEDEVLVFSPPFDEVIQASIPPAQEEENAW
jgi:hypothetical protein